MTERIAKLQALAASKPHGTRSRYNAGCRCDECKRSNRNYEHERIKRKIFHGPARVSADRARAHILNLQRAGLGRHTISSAAGVHDRRISEIGAGERLHIKAETERRILCVTIKDRAAGAYIPAGPTFALIEQLVHDGYTKTQLATWLGYKRPALQFRRAGITQENADRVEALYNKLKDGFIERAGESLSLPGASR
jgi:hypothetical protein